MYLETVVWGRMWPRVYVWIIKIKRIYKQTPRGCRNLREY